MTDDETIIKKVMKNWEIKGDDGWLPLPNGEYVKDIIKLARADEREKILRWLKTLPTGGKYSSTYTGRMIISKIKALEAQGE